MDKKIFIYANDTKMSKTIEETLQNTLVMAQSTAEETKRLAQQQAEQIIREAQATAQQGVEDLKQEIKMK